MNLRYQTGRLLAATETGLVSRRWFPLFRRLLGGRHWMYDACRFSGTRDFRVLFDVGANVGNISREMTRFFPRAEIHAFEPITATFDELKKNCAASHRVHAHRLALADVPGEAVVAIQPSSDLNSLHFQAAHSGAAASEKVEISTVDQFCARNGIDQVDILKVDAQGYDLAVLRGAKGLLRAGAVPFLLGEASFTRGDPTNQEFAPMHEYLTDAGYRACGIYDQLNHGPRLRYLACFNLLYVHPGGLSRRFPTAAPD